MRLRRAMSLLCVRLSRVDSMAHPHGYRAMVLYRPTWPRPAAQVHRVRSTTVSFNVHWVATALRRVGAPNRRAAEATKRNLWPRPTGLSVGAWR